MQPTLSIGDSVGIISSSFAVERQKVEEAIAILKSWGLNTYGGNYLYSVDGPFAGSDTERLKDIQTMINSPDIKAILFSRGGYGLLRIIDKIDFAPLFDYPKWFVGFSDITVIHSWLNNIFTLPTIHGEMLLNYSNDKKTAATLSTLHDALFGTLQPINWQGKVLRPSNCKGKIIGGNLSILYSLIGTLGEMETDGCILFIEDVGEHYYHIDRMLTSLRLAGKLANLSALLVGGFSQMKETSTIWGKNIEEIVAMATCDYNYPVYFNFPSGHINDNRAFYLGCDAQLIHNNEHCTLLY